jgi:prepilin-type N-terminal cleavage/methylation domain-containing protein
MSRLRDERGFTLIELLVSSTIGLVVLFGALTTLESSQRAQSKVSDRSEAIARGRGALEQLVQQLRSQVCIGAGAPAIIYADNSRVTFYADLTNVYTGNPSENDFVPAKRDLIFSSTAGKLTEYVYPGSPVTNNGGGGNGNGNGNNSTSFPYTFASTPSRTRVVLDKIKLRKENGQDVPFFKYYSFSDTDPIRPSNLLTTPLSATDRDNVVQVTVNFQALPSRLNSTYPGEPFTSDVFVRTADPTDPEHSPLCL